MKVNHWVLDDRYGAGRAAVRISNALQNKVESNVFTILSDGLGNSKKIKLSNIEKALKKCSNRLNYEIVRRYKDNVPFHVEKFGITYRDSAFLEADVINVHYVNYGMWTDAILSEIISHNIPVVWTLHDMWAFTGGCHYNGECLGYVNKCGCCPVLESTKINDISLKYQEKKIAQFDKLNIQFVGCSSWITNEFNKSYIGRLAKRPAINIPNPIDSAKFYFCDKQQSRKVLGIDDDRIIISFGAQSAATDSRKGYRYLKEALQNLDPNDYTLLLFGSDFVDDNLKQYNIISFGHVKDDSLLSNIYRASDVFLAPSVQENLANTVMEALSCGTPVLAFDIGGMQDMIKPGQNGYLAKPFDSNDFTKGIIECQKIKDYKMISNNTHKRFSEEAVGREYHEVYNSLIEGKYER